MNTGFLGPAVATVLTVYGIETAIDVSLFCKGCWVATVLTVYGIETFLVYYSLPSSPSGCNSTYRLRY